MEESELLGRLYAIFERTVKSDLAIGNGDDGAVFRPGNKQVVVSTDVAVEGVHFRSDWSSYRQIGRKITAANLADLLAMGAWPEYLLLAVVAPQRHLVGLEELARGIASEADLVGAQVVGGDLSTGDQLTIAITAIGYTDEPITRSGAQIGDAVVVTSLPGSSAAGLALLAEGVRSEDELSQRVIEQHLAPSLEYFGYRKCAPHLSAATDISDGLLIDASHIAAASGVCIALDSAPLEMSELKALDERRYLDWVLTGGEDHVLLATTNNPQATGGVVIGRVVSGSGVTLDGAQIEPAGYRHNWPGKH